jgi:O-antigen/teichoic acid export membrane protein
MNKLLYINLFSTRLINMVGGLLCLYIVASIYEPNEAGQIYTILSLASLVMFFELGLPTLIVQQMSLFTRNEQWNSQNLFINTALIGPLFNHYLSLVLVQSLLLLVILTPIGLWIILTIFGISFMSVGPWAWLLACFAMIMSLPLALLLNTLEGLGSIKVVAKVRLLQSLVSQICLNLALYLGCGYSSIAIQLMCSAITIWGAILIFESKFTKSLFSIIALNLNFQRVRLDWQFQWRLILSFLSGYFSNQAWVVMITLTGAVALAGHVAITLQALTAVVAFSLTPLAAKFSLLSAMAHKDKYREYMDLIKNLCKQSIILFILISVVSMSLPCSVEWGPSPHPYTTLISFCSSSSLSSGVIAITVGDGHSCSTMTRRSSFRTFLVYVPPRGGSCPAVFQL